MTMVMVLVVGTKTKGNATKLANTKQSLKFAEVVTELVDGQPWMTLAHACHTTPGAKSL